MVVYITDLHEDTGVHARVFGYQLLHLQNQLYHVNIHKNHLPFSDTPNTEDTETLK